MEKTEKITKTKAIFATLLVHFGLLCGLFYMNNDKAQDLIPEFVKEWVKESKADEAVATTNKRP